jgi:hypothetical protein
MSLDNLAGMFSQRSGIQQSMSSTIMSTIMNYMMQHFMQKGLSSFLGSGGNDQGSMTSALSQLQGEAANNPNHQLIQQVQQNAGLQDSNQAQQYTQQAIGMMQEHANNNPQGLHSIFGNFANNQGFDLGSLLGSRLGGSGGSSGNTNQQQQQQKKQGDIGDLLGGL